MKFGASTFIWVSPFSDDKLQMVDTVKEFGFDLIEVCIEDLAVISPQKAREAVDRAGIGAIVCGAFGPTRDVSSDDAGIQEEGMSDLRTCIDYAEVIGSPSVIGPKYSATGKAALCSCEGEAVEPGGKEPETCRRICGKKGNQACDRAAQQV